MLTLLTPTDLRLIMGLAFFPIGLFAILAGLLILIVGPYRKEAQILATQSAQSWRWCPTRWWSLTIVIKSRPVIIRSTTPSVTCLANRSQLSMWRCRISSCSPNPLCQ